MPKSRRSANIEHERPVNDSHASNDLPAQSPAIHLGDALPPIDVEVAREAYHLYRDRGYLDGYDFDDWLEAERRVQRRHEAANGDGPGGPLR